MDGRSKTMPTRTVADAARPIASTNATIRVRASTILAPVSFEGLDENGENSRNDGVPRILFDSFSSGPTHGESESVVFTEKLHRSGQSAGIFWFHEQSSFSFRDNL